MTVKCDYCGKDVNITFEVEEVNFFDNSFTYINQGSLRACKECLDLIQADLKEELSLEFEDDMDLFIDGGEA